MPKPRNPVARSPLLKKGGIHQRARSGERQANRKALKQAIETALQERRSRFIITIWHTRGACQPSWLSQG